VIYFQTHRVSKNAEQSGQKSLMYKWGATAAPSHPARVFVFGVGSCSEEKSLSAGFLFLNG
jgi:hypothetical protein